MILFFSIPLNISVTSSMYRSWIRMNALAYYFIKKETLAQAFPVNFAKFLRTLCLQNTSRQHTGRLLIPFPILYSREYSEYHNATIDVVMMS